MKSVRVRIALGLASRETATVAWDRARAARESGREPAFGTRPEATRGPGGEGISKVIKNGTVATADRAWKADVAFHAAVETGGGRGMSGGARKNAPAESDDPEEAFFTAVVDLVICLRGKTPNADLGMTDEFLYVGEWGLARDELMALIDEGNVRRDDRAKESLARLRAVEQRIADETVK